MLALIAGAKRPVLYVGGGIISSEAHDDLKRFAEATNIAVAQKVQSSQLRKSDQPYFTPGKTKAGVTARHSRNRSGGTPGDLADE